MFARKPFWRTIARGLKTSKNPTSVFWVFCVILFVSLFGSLLLFDKGNIADTASPPTVIVYQGKLLENSASVTTTKAMGFAIYDALTGGNILYTASGTLSASNTISITPSNGVFTVELGNTSGSPATNALSKTIFQNNQNLYLEVIIVSSGATTTLSARKQLTTSPYAFNSEYLTGAAATSTASSSTYIPISNSSGQFTFNTTTFGGQLVPNLNNVFDLGGYGVTWNDIFASGTAYLGSIAASGNVTSTGILYASGGVISSASSTFSSTLSATGAMFASSTFLIGNAAGSDDFYVSDGASRFGNTNASSTLAIYGATTITGSLLSQTGHNNLYDLGAYGSAWQDIFASGTVRISGASGTSLSIGGEGNGEAQVYVRATSTEPNTVLLIDDVSGDALFTVRDGSTDAVVSGAQTSVAAGAIVDIRGTGSGAGVVVAHDGGGFISVHNDGRVLAQLLPDDISGDANSGGFLLANGASTTTITLGDFRFAKASGYDAGTFFVNSSGNTSASGTLQVFGLTTLANVSSTMISPLANNTSDFGAYGSAWRNVYASGTTYLGATTTLRSSDAGAWGNEIQFVHNSASPAAGDGIGVFTTRGLDSAGNTEDYTKLLMGIQSPTNGSEQGAFVVYVADGDGDGDVPQAMFIGNDGSVVNFQLGPGGVPVNFWANASTMKLGSVTFTSSTFIFGNASSDEDLTVASGAITIGNTGISSTTLTVHGDVDPGNNNNMDLGAYGTAWNDIFASGTLYAGTLFATNLLGGALNLTTDATGNIIRDPSDMRLKTNITTITGALDKVLQLRGVSYNWTQEANMGEQRDYGLIAQEVEQVVPELASHPAVGWMGVKYTNMVGLLVEAVKEQQLQIQSLIIGNELQGSTGGNITVDKLTVRSHVIFNADTVGQVKILAGAERSHVTFAEEYEYQPIITVTPVGIATTTDYGVENVNTKGFDIVIYPMSTVDMVLNWHAFGSEEGKMFVSDGTVEEVRIVVVDSEQLTINNEQPPTTDEGSVNNSGSAGGEMSPEAVAGEQTESTTTDGTNNTNTETTDTTVDTTTVDTTTVDTTTVDTTNTSGLVDTSEGSAPSESDTTSMPADGGSASGGTADSGSSAPASDGGTLASGDVGAGGDGL